MANLTQSPNQYNVAYVPNVFTLDDLAGADLYLLRVLINGTSIAEFRQPPNGAGVAHFDVSKVLQSYLEPDFVETTEKVKDTVAQTIEYQVQYATVTNNIIDANVTTDSVVRTVINGTDDWRTLNWNDTDYNPSGLQSTCRGAGQDPSVEWSEAEFLTNYPLDKYPLRSSTYHTLSFFNRLKNYNDGNLYGGTTIQPAFVQIKFYTSASTLIQTSIYSIDDTNGLGPRTNYNSAIQNAYTLDEIVGTVGVGPQNLKDAGIWPNGSGIPAQVWNQVVQQWQNNINIWNLGGTIGALVDNYSIEIYSLDYCYWQDNGAPVNDDATTLQDYLGDLIYSFDFKVTEPCSNFDPITLSFINQYGVKDYFTFDRRNQKTISANRSNYTKSTGSWNDSTFSIDQHSGGKTTFNTDIETELLLSSYWMSDEESKWLNELFASSNAQAFIDGQWEPVIIGTNVYEEKTYARDKMFQHTITVQYSNNRKIQRG